MFAKTALKLNGGHMTSFAATIKGVIDLSTPLTKVHTPMKWEELKNKTIKNESVMLSRFGDIHPFSHGPIFHCETLILNICDKNFLCYWFNKRTFPNLKTTYIASHPCDFYVLDRSDMGLIFLTEDYKHYKHRWWPNNDNVQLITSTTYEELLSQLENTSILFD